MEPTSRPVLRDAIGLVIDPLDTLFFRDGRPFGPMDTGYSGLPLPQTVAGMIRAYIMQSLDLEPSKIHRLREMANGVSPYQRAIAFIACRGPWLVKVKDCNVIENIFVSPPAHLCRVGGDEEQLVLLRPLGDDFQLPGWRSPQSERQNHLRPLLYIEGPESVEPESRWLDKEAIISVLQDKAPDPHHLLCSRSLFTWEDRTGVTISPETSTGENSLLYSSQQLRLERGIALYAEIGWETVDDAHQDTLRRIQGAFDADIGWDRLFPETGILLPLGGEGRRVSVKRAKTFSWSDIAVSNTKVTQRAVTWLISPLTNYQHSRTEGQRNPWEPMSLGKLVGASCPKPLALSGWDMAADEARPTRYAVPAGSVYFWERGTNADQSKEWLPGSLLQLSENAKDRANGWGMALKGVW